MAQDTSGAPASFAFNTPQGVPQLDYGNDAGQSHTGVDGGQGVGNGATQGQMQQPTSTANPTLDLLMQAGSALLAPMLKQAKTSAYIQGMQRAMSGEAVTSIAADQPWYSKLFGESDVTEGARAYTGNTVAQTQVAAMTDAMPQLRTMDAAGSTKYFTDSVNSALTGDPATDLSIMQSMTRALPAVMREQAKQHFGWQQEQATAAEDSSFKAQTDALQKLGPSVVNGYTTTDEFNQASQAFVRSQVPAAGRDLKNWQTAQTNRFVEAARIGNFHAINAAMAPQGADDQGNGGTSLMDTLTDEQQSKVQEAIKSGQGTQRNNYLLGTDVVAQRSAIEAMASHPDEGVSPPDILAKAQDMNDTFQKLTGNKLGVFDGNELAALGKGSANAIWTARDEEWKRGLADAARREALGAKGALADTKNAATDAALFGGNGPTVNGAPGSGGLYQLAATPGYDDKDIDYRAQQTWRGMSPQQQTQALLINDKYVIKPISKELDDGAQSAMLSPTMDGAPTAVYQKWKALYDQSPAVAASYYPKAGPKLEKFNNMVTNEGFDPNTAYQSAIVNPVPSVKPDRKVLEAQIATIQGQENGLFKTNMNPDAIKLLADASEQGAADWGTYLNDPKSGSIRAYNALKATGTTESVGSYAWNIPKVNGQPDASYRMLPWLTKMSGSHPQPAGGQVALPTDNVGTVFNNAVDEFVNGSRRSKADGSVVYDPGITQGKTVAHTMIMPIKPGTDGVPRFQISVVDTDGNAHQGLLTGNDVFRLNGLYKKSNQYAGQNGKGSLTAPFSTPGATTADQIANRPNIVGYNPNPN